MRPFRFRLERLNTVRRIEEELARASFADAERTARNAEERAGRCAAGIEAGESELALELARPTLDAARILASHAALAAAARALARASGDARVARVRAERERALWDERRKTAEALENLRARAVETHRREEEARENARIDEQALLRAGRARADWGRRALSAEPRDAEH